GNWAAADLSHAEGWFLEGNVVGLQNLREKSFQQVSLPFYPERVYPALKGMSLVNSSVSGSWAVLRSTPEGIRVLASGNGENIRVGDPLHYFLVREDVFYLLSLASGEPRLIPTEVPASNSLRYISP